MAALDGLDPVLGRDLARALREFPDELAGKLVALHRFVKQALAANPRAPERLLRRVAADPVAGVEAVLAANPACPADLLAGLGGHPDEAVRGAVAANPSTLPEVLAAMVEPAAGRVAGAFSRRPDLPADAGRRPGSAATCARPRWDSPRGRGRGGSPCSRCRLGAGYCESQSRT